MVTVSAPGKIHLLGEHAVVYGKPALLATVDRRVYVHISDKPTQLTTSAAAREIQDIVESIVIKEFAIEKMPPYYLTITSELPFGVGLGFSAAVCASAFAALLSFMHIEWKRNDINRLAYEAEKVFHGNPSGADNSSVIFGGLVWYRKEKSDVKTIHQLGFRIPSKLAQNFVIMNTGVPKESTKQMVGMVQRLYKKDSQVVEKFLQNQEILTKELVVVVKEGREGELVRIMKEGERNLETIGVVSDYASSFIRAIEQSGGAAKICGAGGKRKAAGVLLAYHPEKAKLIEIGKSFDIPYFGANLGGEGLRIEL